MGSIIGTLFAFAIVFGVLVFVHEFGHFFTAKLVGIKVEVFSWGYGKRLFGIKRKETDYRVSLIPMGGYVKFSGEEAYAGQETVDPTKIDPRDFMAKKRWQRFLVLVMGSVMNIVLAVVLVSFINMIGVTVPEYQQKKPVIGWIEPGSPAESAHLKIDDEILSINNKKTKTWADVELAVGTKPEKTLTLEIKRNHEILTVKLTTESKTRYDMGYAGFFGKIMTQIMSVEPHSPAEKAGLKPGDVILTVNGEPADYYQFIEIIKKSPGKQLELLIKRDGRTLSLHLTPRHKGDVGEIGVSHGPKIVEKRYSFFRAINRSIKQNVQLAFLVVNFVKDLLVGEASTRQLGGPIEIANVSYAAFRQGFMAMLVWIAFISLQLGIVNLIPIPVLDGGQIFVLVLEGIFRRDFSLKLKQVVMKIGFAIFIFLIIFIILNDVQKRLPNGWQSFLPW
jgi:regulator of sigma E protease